MNLALLVACRVEHPNHALVGGEFLDGLRLHPAGHGSNQNAVSVGDGGDDAVGQLVLQFEEIVRCQLSVEGVGPEVGAGGGIQQLGADSNLTQEDAREFHDIVARLDAVAARRAAELPPDSREAMARELSSRNRAFLEGSVERDVSPGKLVELDHAFHAAYVDAVAGPRLMALRKAAKPQIARYAWSYASLILERIPESVAEHEVIIEAIRAGDADRGEQAVLSNWDRAAQRVRHAIEQAGEGGGW